MLELSTGKIDKMEETNGRYSDSYHSWSSNSQWIAFASKRDDRVYGRPYFAHVSQDGSVSKAFLLPQENPEVHEYGVGARFRHPVGVAAMSVLVERILPTA